MPGGIRIHGISEVIRALDKVDTEISRDLKDELEKAGELVRKEATRRFQPRSPFSAQGFVTRVRPFSRGSLVSVEQNLRKTTGSHPAWGALQMTEALVPAREAKLPEVYDRLDHVVDRVIATHGF